MKKIKYDLKLPETNQEAEIRKFLYKNHTASLFIVTLHKYQPITLTDLVLAMDKVTNVTRNTAWRTGMRLETKNLIDKVTIDSLDHTPKLLSKKILEIHKHKLTSLTGSSKKLREKAEYYLLTEKGEEFLIHCLDTLKIPYHEEK